MLRIAWMPAWDRIWKSVMQSPPLPDWISTCESRIVTRVTFCGMARYVTDVEPGVQELALVSRLRAGNVEAFDVVYDQFNARLFSFLAGLSRRRDITEDLLEETWLRLVSQARRLLGPIPGWPLGCSQSRAISTQATAGRGSWKIPTPPA